MKINRTIYGYNYETELTIDELKAAREEYADWLKYEELFRQLKCYTSFNHLSPQNQKKIAQTISLQSKDLASVLGISPEEAAKSLVPAVMFSLESFAAGGSNYDLS